MSTLNTNPIILDSRGQAVIYGNGSYRQILRDSLGNLIWDKPVYANGSGTGGDIYPVEAYGAVGDAYQVTNCSITSGQKRLLSSGNSFILFTGTKAVVVNNAGAVLNELFTDLITTATFVSTGELLLANSAGATISSGGTATIGTDNTTHIQAALDDSAHGLIGIQNGLYLCTSSLTWPIGKQIYGAGTPTGNVFESGIMGPGSLYAHQANIATDPLAGVGGGTGVTSASQSGNTATYTLSGAVPSWMTVGCIVTVAGMTPSGYNFTNTVVSTGVGTFTMLVPSTGLGGSSVGGRAISNAGKRYVVVNAGGTPENQTSTYNLNISACNNTTTIPWGCLWSDTGIEDGQWKYDFFNCYLTGFVGRHLMWQNANQYSNCVYQGYWAADAFTMPGGLSNAGNVQTVNDVSCIFSQLQDAYGRIHYEYNLSGVTSTFSAWSVVCGTLQGGFAFGNFTGNSYAISAVHIEAFSAPAALFVDVAGSPATSTGAMISPDIHLAIGQYNAFIAAFGLTGASPGWTCNFAGIWGVSMLNANQVAGAGITPAAATLVDFSNPVTSFNTGLDFNLKNTTSNTTGRFQATGAASGNNIAAYFHAANAALNYSLYLDAGFIQSQGTSVLPTGDPHVVGRWWNNAGVVTVSAG